MKKLVKTQASEKKITGVCGGMGNYFTIDPTIVRITFALFFFCYGVGLGIYIILALIMPKENQPKPINA